MVGLSDFVKGELGKGKRVGMVLLDFRKAFNTVDHGIMIENLKALGVFSTDWFWPYLMGRQQLASVDRKESSFMDVTCGVPQGSILRFLFLLYVNDMHISVSCRLALYADDCVIFCSG